MDIEDYLTRVVPSEMPSSYEVEALKAQAVCARTYAYRQIQANAYSQYGAHVDDSTNYQVYNNIDSNERTNLAIKETDGEMVFYGDTPAETYYFQPPAAIPPTARSGERTLRMFLICRELP